ncbi:MAG: ROK family protein [Candidatus Pacebacteria bacterium]|nr:ROK family protein [Candidatus Paceibacterota bacterium]
MSTLLFDIGGTHMRVAISSHDDNKIGQFKKTHTPKNFDEGVSLLKQLADETVIEMGLGTTIDKVVGGVAGIFDSQEKNMLFCAPNLPGWAGKPLRSELERIFAAPVYLENDAALAGLGEALVGAGRDFHSVMYMTVSTGVGGAKIVGGKIDEKVFDFEPGLQIVNFNEADKNKKVNRLEDYISGLAVEKRFGKKPLELTDLEDQKNWDQLAEWLAYGLHNSIVHWSPDVVVLGGAMILGSPSISLEKVEQKLKALLTIFPKIPILKKAELGDQSGLYGALKFLAKK